MQSGPLILKRKLFFSTLPRRGKVTLSIAVFLMFAPISVLLFQCLGGAALSVPSVVVAGVHGGLTAVAWMLSFVWTRRLMLLAIPLATSPPFVMPWVFKLTGSDPGPVQIEVSRALLILTCVLMLISSYVLFIRVMRGQAARTYRMQVELDLAQQIHANLVPPIELGTVRGEVYGRSIASSEMGGDLIDALEGEVPETGGKHLDVLLADVSGHGVSAGVVMAMLKASVRTRLLRSPRLAEVAADANRVLTDLTAPNMFATFAAIRLLPNGTMEYSLAGHLPILHYCAAAKRWDQHLNQSLPLGVDQSEQFVTGVAPIGPGDVMAMFTDGLTEVQDSKGRELTLEGVIRIVQREVGAGGALSQVHRRVLEAVAAHGPRLDDQSLLLVQAT